MPETGNHFYVTNFDRSEVEAFKLTYPHWRLLAEAYEARLSQLESALSDARYWREQYDKLKTAQESK